MLEKEAATIALANEIIEAIDTFRGHNTPDNVTLSRIKNLCKFKRQRAELSIDMALDAMEQEMKGDI